jgi:hypothetical protein
VLEQPFGSHSGKPNGRENVPAAALEIRATGKSFRAPALKIRALEKLFRASSGNPKGRFLATRRSHSVRTGDEVIRGIEDEFE